MVITKENEKEVSEMCKAMEDLRNESYAEGMAQGIMQGISQGVSQEKGLRIRKYLMLHNNPQEAAKLFELPIDNVLAISKELSK